MGSHSSLNVLIFLYYYYWRYYWEQVLPGQPFCQGQPPVAVVKCFCFISIINIIYYWQPVQQLQRIIKRQLYKKCQDLNVLLAYGQSVWCLCVNTHKHTHTHTHTQMEWSTFRWDTLDWSISMLPPICRGSGCRKGREIAGKCPWQVQVRDLDQLLDSSSKHTTQHTVQLVQLNVTGLQYIIDPILRLHCHILGPKCHIICQICKK